MSITPLTCFRPPPSVLLAADEVANTADRRAEALDEDFSFPEADVAALQNAGLLSAPFPRELGGEGLAIGHPAVKWLEPALRRLGAVNLALGRLYEGHVNAVGLIMRYGRDDQLAAISEEVAGGILLGVWNSDDPEGLHIVTTKRGWRLRGGKVLCSGRASSSDPWSPPSMNRVTLSWSRRDCGGASAPISRPRRRTACGRPRRALSTSPTSRSTPTRSSAAMGNINGSRPFLAAHGAS